MSAIGEGARWGDRVLGDLVDAAWQTAKLVGHAAKVDRLQLDVPADGSPLLRARVWVADVNAAERIRRAVEGGYVVNIDGEGWADSWCAEVDGIELTVLAEEF